MLRNEGHLSCLMVCALIIVSGRATQTSSKSSLASRPQQPLISASPPPLSPVTVRCPQTGPTFQSKLLRTNSSPWRPQLVLPAALAAKLM